MTGTARQITFTYYDKGLPETVHTATGEAAVLIASDDEPLNGHLVITDVLTGISINYNLGAGRGDRGLDVPRVADHLPGAAGSGAEEVRVDRPRSPLPPSTRTRA